MLRLVALAAAALHCSAAADCISVPRRPNCVWWRSGSTPRSKAAKKIIWCQERSCCVGHGSVATQQKCHPGAWGHSSVWSLHWGVAQPRGAGKSKSFIAGRGEVPLPLPWAGGGDSLSRALADVTTCLAKCAQLQKHRVLSVFASQWHHKAPAKSKPDTLCRISCTGWAQLCRENRGRQQRRGKFLFQGH